MQQFLEGGKGQEQRVAGRRGALRGDDWGRFREVRGYQGCMLKEGKP